MGKFMSLILTVVIHLCHIMEMVVINLYVVDTCLTSKFSRLQTTLIYTAFTAAVLGTSFYTRVAFQMLPNADELGMLIGMIYLIPIYFIYEEPLRYKLSVIFTTWIYTMSAYSLSIRIAMMLYWDAKELLILIVQTIFFIFTCGFFLRVVKERLLYIFQRMDSQTVKWLLWLSGLAFGLCILSLYSFAVPDSYIADALFTVLLLNESFMIYRFIYVFLVTKEQENEMKKNLYIDDLTLLKNRNGFSDDIERFIQTKIPFTLFFMDLDGLKKINDSHGHLMGDAYLKAFANAIKGVLDSKAEFYRISGDEFICIYQGDNPETALEKLRHPKFKTFNCRVAFRGVSVGSAAYPEDGTTQNQLVSTADEAMYLQKKQKSEF